MEDTVLGMPKRQFDLRVQSAKFLLSSPSPIPVDRVLASLQKEPHAMTEDQARLAVTTALLEM